MSKRFKEKVSLYIDSIGKCIDFSPFGFNELEKKAFFIGSNVVEIENGSKYRKKLDYTFLGKIDKIQIRHLVYV